MAIQVQNFPKKDLGQISGHSLPYASSVSHPLWWNSNEHQIAQSLSSISLKVESPSRAYHGANYLGLQLPVQESSSVQSIGQTHHEVSVIGGTNSHSNSSDSGEDEHFAYQKDIEGQMKPVFMLGNPNSMFDPSQTSNNLPMACARYPYADAYFGGSFTPNGQLLLPQIQMGHQMAGGRIPLLPLDLAEDGAVYVNPKQYHGILRRRQSRAKLEAQNKLVKTRKPYLHESRHRHALNRVRGSGGRFLSKKQLQQLDRKNKTDTSEFSSHFSGNVEYVGSRTSCSDIGSVSNADMVFRQPELRFSGMSYGGANVTSSGNQQHCAPVVR